MLSAALVGCLTSGTENAVDNVHLTSGEGRRNSVASSFVIARSLVGSSTLSSITNCSVENTDVAVGPYGIGGALGCRPAYTRPGASPLVPWFTGSGSLVRNYTDSAFPVWNPYCRLRSGTLVRGNQFDTTRFVCARG